MIFVAMLLIILAVMLILFGVLSWTRNLPGNSLVGLRVPEVRKSQEAWEAAHATAGPIWTFGGVALLVGGLLGFVSGGWIWLFVTPTVVIALVAVSLGANVGARTASLVDAPSDDQAGGCGGDCNCGSPAVDMDALRRAVSEADKN